MRSPLLGGRIAHVMLTLELSSYALEILNDAFTIISQNLIDCSAPSQEHCKLIC